eukprot:4289167-Heterocapsa_arctica.AAC.1
MRRRLCGALHTVQSPQKTGPIRRLAHGAENSFSTTPSWRAWNAMHTVHSSPQKKHIGSRAAKRVLR